MVFGGHSQELEELTEVFESLDFGENHSVLISGLRGAGKTSMLTKLQDVAMGEGWLVISDDASAGLMDRVMETSIPVLINSLDVGIRKRLTELGLWRLNAKWEYVDRHREVKPQLRRDLMALAEQIGAAGILITIDEVSSGKVRLRELARFALEVSHALEDGADIMIVFAGIKVDLEALVDQDHTTFLRRSRELDFRRLTPSETEHVLAETVRIGGRRIEAEALALLVRVAQGYPYLVQLAGDYAWRQASHREMITLADAEVAHDRAIRAVLRRVISRIYQDLSDKDQAFLRAMAVDDDRSRIADIVERLGTYGQYVQVYKKRLIDSGYVQSDGHGYIKFSLPYLGHYVSATMSATEDAQAPKDEWEDFPPPKSL